MALGMTYESSVRKSDITDLLRRVQRRTYDSYLHSMKLIRLRAYSNAEIFFDFPVTALVGPNGGGKTTILGAAAISSSHVKPRVFFAKSGKYDKSMVQWRVEYDATDSRASRRLIASYPSQKWDRSTTDRPVLVFGVARTLPATERKELTRFISGAFTGVAEKEFEEGTIEAVGTILGKDAANYLLVSASKDGKQQIYAASTADEQHYSEFHFGAGEASVIRIVSDIEGAPDNSLILIEEIENGLHPVAVRKLVEYLVAIARRKRCQVIFTTHSNEALSPLPDEAVWACGNGVVSQGKLDVESLRALTGSVEASLTVFVEDEFGLDLVLAALRSYSRRTDLKLLGIDPHFVGGEANVRKFTIVQNDNPATSIPAIGFLDGDMRHSQDPGKKLFCLPGVGDPEIHIYEVLAEAIDDIAPKLAIALSMPTSEQDRLRRVVPQILRTNRDPHLLFKELGDELEFMSAATVRTAFLGIWAELRTDEVDAICSPIHDSVRPDLITRP